MGIGRAASRLRKAAKHLFLLTSRSPSPSLQGSTTIVKQNNSSLPHQHDEATHTVSDSTTPASTQILCAICLEPLSNCDHSEVMFTGQCSHAFHFSCIASNVRHGSLTCPVCRALWTHLPCFSPTRQLDHPVFRVRDDSIATSRIHGEHDPPHYTNHPRLNFSLIPLTVSPNLVSYPCCVRSLQLHQSAYSPLQRYTTGMDTDHGHLTYPFSSSLLPHPSFGNRYAYLSVKLTNLQPIDLVLVVSPSEPHLHHLKQAVILVTLSLQPVDRLAIVTYSCVPTRVFALRRMTSCGKQAALRMIDHLFCLGQTDPSQGIRKGIKVLKDRAYKNPQCSVLHISSSPISSYGGNSVMQKGVMVHRFHVGFETETWSWFVMHKLKEFLARVLGGIARDIKLRIGMEGKVVKIGELRGGEERQVLVDLGVHANVRLRYSYVEGDTDESIRIRGETTTGFW